ncbi:MAG TPA: maleylpyruvate isomerase family mycothiol-dependent enzyme [Mycobacteriales bacterium]|nr:maleylpyruvate isomerase family mycothiol-dependent enzyme [Mycobacteriales bacterium]
MTLTRQSLTDGLLAELDSFGDLVRGLSDEEWAAPSRCADWSAGDVAAHLIGTMADIAAGRFDGLGTPEVTQREVDERRGRSPKELADECVETRQAAAGLLPMFDEAAWDGPAPGGFDGTVGDAVEALWFDAYVHADDIRAATGRQTEIGPGLEAAKAHVGKELAKLGWHGELPTADRDAHAFVLAATGRAPADSVAGNPPNIYA